MGHIKEPEGVDFIIQSKPLTEEDRIAISAYIREYKKKQKGSRNSGKAATGTKRKKSSI